MEQTAQTMSRKSHSTIAPKAEEIERKKAKFIKHLKCNGGVVSAALSSAGIARRTAYDHFNTDVAFAERWLEALEISGDKLIAEAHRRAIHGNPIITIDKSGRKTTYYKKSDRLLMQLIKNSETRNKWKRRLVHTGNVAINTVRVIGAANDLTPRQIQALQNALAEEFNKISLK